MGAFPMEELNGAASVEGLVGKARGGDRYAEAMLFDKLQARIQALAEKRVRDRESARDIAQETLRIALEKYRHVDLAHGFYPWVFTILRNQVGNYLKRRRRDLARLAPLAGGEGMQDPSSGQDVKAIDLLHSIENALRRASPECQKIFRLLLEGAGRRELSAAFDGEPIGTIDSRISRCRARLLAYLGREGRKGKP